MTPSQLAPERGLVTERSQEPIVAWRAWALGGSQQGDDPYLRPVAARAQKWHPREVAVASCQRHRTHDAPALDCLCGLHASTSFDVLRRTRCPAVIGRVALWGRIVEHERGYRASFGYPQRLRLICQFCFWQRGPLAGPPTVVGWYPRDHLLPFCDFHLTVARALGLGPRRLLDPDAVDQHLRSAYAVDPLAL